RCARRYEPHLSRHVTVAQPRHSHRRRGARISEQPRLHLLQLLTAACGTKQRFAAVPMLDRYWGKRTWRVRRGRVDRERLTPKSTWGGRFWCDAQQPSQATM